MFLYVHDVGMADMPTRNSIGVLKGREGKLHDVTLFVVSVQETFELRLGCHFSRLYHDRDEFLASQNEPVPLVDARRWGLSLGPRVPVISERSGWNYRM